jgi:hypothetical protein
VPELGEARSCDEADVAGTEDCNLGHDCKPNAGA